MVVLQPMTSCSIFSVDLQVPLAEYTDVPPELTEMPDGQRIRASQLLSDVGDSARVQRARGSEHTLDPYAPTESLEVVT